MLSVIVQGQVTTKMVVGSFVGYTHILDRDVIFLPQLWQVRQLSI